MTDPAQLPADVVRTVPEGRVVYGMQLPIQSQSTLYVADWEKESGPAELARIAQVADEADFFYLGVCDHTAIPRRLAEAMGTVWYDTTATLGWLAALTTRTHLLSHVLILAQRHPLRAAKELSTLDALSGGRLIVGVGAGHVPEEYELFTGGFDERGRHTDEAVAALARCFTAEFPELPGPRFPAATWDSPHVPFANRGHLSGSAARHRRRSAARPHMATAGCPRHSPQGPAGPDRPAPRTAGGNPRGRPDRHRHHCRADLPQLGGVGLGPARLGALGARRAGGGVLARAGGDGCEPPSGALHGPQRRRVLRADGALRGRSGAPADPLSEPQP